MKRTWNNPVRAILAGRIEARDAGAVTMATHLSRLTLPAVTLARDELSAGVDVSVCFRPEHLLPREGG